MKKQLVRINLEARLPLIFIQGVKDIIAFSPALDLATQGRTREEAMQNLKEATALFFEEAKANLNEVLIELGWSKADKTLSPPVYIGEFQEPIRETLLSARS